MLKLRMKNKVKNVRAATPVTTCRIIAVNDCYHHTGKIYIKIQMIGTAQTFNCPVSELYQKQSLERFSREDATHIAALYSAEQTKDFELIDKFPSHNPATKNSIIIIGILFTAFLILSNLVAVKLVSFGTVTVTAGLIFFPLTYVFDDILTEVYGFKVSRRVIWSAMLANLIIFLGTWVTIYFPPAPYWHNQVAYETIYQATSRIFIASMLGYLMGEFSNSIILAKLKVLTAGHYFWMRAISSTAVGVGIDTILFAHIAFVFLIPYEEVWKIIMTTYLFKLAYEICAVPITYKVSNYLKAKDNVDHYDVQTKFNPFSIKV